MATNYPTSLDTFTNPSAGSALNSPSHAGQHADINDAMEAVQTKLGTGAGTIGEWTAFTPSWNNLTIGDGTDNWHYAVVNEVLFIEGRTVLGSTTTVGTQPGFDLPNAYTLQNFGQPYGIVLYNDSGTGNFLGHVVPDGSGSIRFVELNVSGSLLKQENVTANSPFTWISGDQIRAQMTIRLT